MNFSPLFQRYETLVIKADEAFKKMANDYSGCVKCERHCSDCCHAVFGLFLIEAAYLKHHFDALDRKERRAATLRGNKTDKDFEELEKKIKIYKDDPQMASYSLSRARIQCPLLNNNQDCILYSHRPITCRVYGIPMAIHGKAHVCGKADFRKGKTYPTFNLDEVQRELYLLSKELLEKTHKGDAEKASFLISVSKAIKSPIEHVIEESFG